MARRVLHESRLVAETVVAIGATAMEVRLVVAVATVGELTVLVEAELEVALRNGLVLEHFERSSRGMGDGGGAAARR